MLLGTSCIVPELRIKWAGVEWKTGRNPKMEKNWLKIENVPRPDMWEMALKTQKKKNTIPNPSFSPFLGHFFPMSGRGPFSLFFLRRFFSHFRPFGPFSILCQPPDLQFCPRRIQADFLVRLLVPQILHFSGFEKAVSVFLLWWQEVPPPCCCCLDPSWPKM